MNSQPKIRNRYLNIYFQVHQPRRLGQFSFFDIGTGRSYFDDGANQIIMQRIARDCYLPTNLLLLKLINQFPQIRITFSISGSALKQMERYAPAVIESFKMLAATGCVEFLGETYYHSLASLVNPDEFKAQVKMHRDKIKHLLGVTPTVFRNTELIYSDDIGRVVSDMGFNGIFTDGFYTLMNQYSPHYLYRHPDRDDLRIFFRNYQLSDDIAFRYAQKEWKSWPLTPKKYLRWLQSIPERENLVTLGLDYETFGEHQKRETGIFKFLEGLVISLANDKNFKMVTPSEAIRLFPSGDTFSVPGIISWADEAHDLSAWLGNEMQQDAFDTIKNLEQAVKATGNPAMLNTWRYLQTSDHFYYMSTKTGDDGKVHNYFSPYSSPYEAFMNYMNIVTDFSNRLQLLINTKQMTTYANKPTVSVA
jgi:alpha-amylase